MDIYNVMVKVKATFPKPIIFLLKTLRDLGRGDFGAILNFLRNDNIKLSLIKRLMVIKQFYLISYKVDCIHTQSEILEYVTSILEMPPTIKGYFVEAGCYKGGSTSKFSIAAALSNRKLVVFDSFKGIPDHDESHDKNIFGTEAKFDPGSYLGSFEEVKKNIAKFGNLEVCTLIKGWFEDTMSIFHEPLAGVYLDCDLASSTRTCLKYLYPLLEKGGLLFSQDGHLPLVIEVFQNDDFWHKEIGCQKPFIHGLGKKRLIKIIK